ncbi:MAG TPA: S46 family peptidase [Terriglobales bacterium]
MIKRGSFLLLLILVISFLSSNPAVADEGMWLFNAFPGDKVKAKYGYAPSQEWLDHVRLSSARAPNGSSSFVSPDGLIFTNHHIAQGCIHDLSTGGKDYMKAGFYAATRAEEPNCPGVQFVVLEGIEDVTDKVNAAAKPGMSSADAGKAQREAMSALEKDCSVNGLRCDVVTLYSGALYHLYKYKEYNDIRLVMAPEFDIAFFGGDPDNFEYPRYDLDISFFRAYENDKPAKTPNYLKWSPIGIKEDDLVFVSGHPGRTNRLLTTDQLAFLRDYQYPMLMAALANRVVMLQNYGAESPEKAREAESDLFGAQNSAKAYDGYNAGLHDKSLMDKKAAEEKSLKAYVKADPERQQEFGDPWAEISKAVEVQKQIYKPLFYLQGGADNDANAASAMGGFRGSLAVDARLLVRATEEKQKPNGERLRGYQDSALPSLEQRLFSTAPVYKSLQRAQLTQSLTEMQQVLGADDEAVKAALAGKSPAERAKGVIEGTQLQDVAVRKQLYEGGKAAVDASTDPLIVMMRNVDPYARAVRKRYDDEVDPLLRKNAGDIAKLRFAQGGLSVPPDATFTLRLSYGAIKGYELNGKHVPWYTTMGGTYDRAAAHGSKPPFELPASWIKAKSSLDLKTPFNTVSTPDIIGGNSGSPLVNKNAEVVGIIFDGNIQSLAWNFVYDDVVGRAISTDSRAILEALRKIYHADRLADELTGTAAAGKSKAMKPATSQR